ncbi:MAG: hypothetical protein KAU94_05050 [Verrucomicrobia bacterium]|nr:hypothetical protein [Verrucomicrobiota bacterium]
MKAHRPILIVAMATLGAAALSVSAQSINLWRGNETGADWNDVYKWNLQHVPSGTEAVHFRKQSSVISVNSTIELGNGMHLYGQELLLEGNGNINLRSPISYQRTITIPASSSGYANLTLTDNLSVNAHISLAAKAFGTSASKGSVTLRNRSTVSGEVTIGNGGNGSGQIVLRDQSTYRITRLKLDTLASKGGSAEIHILGGTARFAGGDNPFEMFLADSSRKIILGNYGTLYIESDMPIELKRRQLEKMISQKQLVAASGCKLGTPVIRDGMLSLKAEDTIVVPQPNTRLAGAGKTPKETVSTTPPPQIAKIQPSQSTVAPQTATAQEKTPAAPLSGYIVFFSALLLLAVRPVKTDAATGGASRFAGGAGNRGKGTAKDLRTSPKVIDINKAA